MNFISIRKFVIASGVHLYRIVSESGYTDTKRMTLLEVTL